MQQHRINHRQKIISAETEIVGKNLVSAVVSTEDKDRDGDIIRAEGWQLDHFLKHPILLSSHDYGSLTNVIGEWKDMQVKGKQLRGVAEYYVGEGNAQADWGFKLAGKGRAAYSVGFIPDFAKAKELEGGGFFPNYEFKGQELLEVSHVTVPSNRQALQQVKALTKHPVIAELIADLLDEDPASDDDNEAKILEAILAKVRPELRSWVEALEARLTPLEAMVLLLPGDVPSQPIPGIILTEAIKAGLKEAING